MALTAITVAVLIIIVISLGRERHGIAFTHRGAAAELGTKRPEKSSLRAKRSNPGRAAPALDCRAAFGGSQ